MSRSLKNGPTSIKLVGSGFPQKRKTTPGQTDEESFRIQHAKLTGLEPARQRSNMKGQSSEPQAVGTSGVDNPGANSVSKLHGRFQISHQFGQTSRPPSDFIRKKFYWCPRSSTFDHKRRCPTLVSSVSPTQLANRDRRKSRTERRLKPLGVL